MFTIGAKRSAGSLGISKCSTSVSRKKLRPPTHARPLAVSGRSAPTQPRISSERRDKQIARLPSHQDASASSTRQGTPWCASSAASDKPTGPPPAINTGTLPGREGVVLIAAVGPGIGLLSARVRAVPLRLSTGVPGWRRLEPEDDRAAGGSL